MSESADRMALRTIPTRVGRTRFGGSGALIDSRTIPTRVGRTPPGSAAWSPSADHPHAGGENAGFDYEAAAALRTIPTRVGRTHPSTVAMTTVNGPSPRGWGER